MDKGFSYLFVLKINNITLGVSSSCKVSVSYLSGGEIVSETM
jgi:hypothetical protein